MRKILIVVFGMVVSVGILIADQPGYKYHTPEAANNAIREIYSQNKDAASLIETVRRNIDRAHIAARVPGAKVDDRAALKQLAQAQSFYKRAEFAQAEELARSALETSKLLLKQ